MSPGRRLLLVFGLLALAVILGLVRRAGAVSGEPARGAAPITKADAPR